jgi:beta-xylosidase
MANIPVDTGKRDTKKMPRLLTEHIYTADPSAHVFNGRIYIYTSHDIDAGTPFNDLGDHFAMEDYHVFSLASPQSEIIDHGVVLHLKNVPWAKQQMWAPDAAYKNGKYYLYFPAKNKEGIFQIGVAVSNTPEGPFIPEVQPISGTYSIDPAVFRDTNGNHYIFFGGIWGGQLQQYRNNQFNQQFNEPSDKEAALGPRVALLSEDMLQLAEEAKEILILDEYGKPLLAGDHERRFFEGPWMHKHNGKYYFSYSTGNTHYICYAIGDNPYGPFYYKGRILNPVIGWTTHHSICEFEGKTYLFYHDSSLSGGITHLRSVKMVEISYDDEDRIITVDPYGDTTM